MPLPRATQGKKLTYGDYLTWPDPERWELIQGVPYDMTPAPGRRHQETLLHLATRFYTYLEDKPCQVYVAPFDVRLPKGEEKDEDIETVVQPDLSVVCDSAKLDDKGCKGAPDLIVEVVSSSTASKDYIQKLSLYERTGVREYWIVHPVDKIAMIYRLSQDGTYSRPSTYSADDKVTVGIFKDLTIDLKLVFRD
jgi:Uma2 family endonuclease